MALTKLKFSLLALSVVLSVGICYGQGFEPPEAGKSAVYFVRLSSAGFAIPFDFYDNDKLIGSFAGRNYMRYEAAPGEHLFWASSENYDFMTAELKAGGIYVVLVDVEMGVAVARVGLTPIGGSDKRFEKVKKLVDKKGPKEKDPEKLEASATSRKTYVEEALSKYEEKWKDKRTYQHLSPDMAIELKM